MGGLYSEVDDDKHVIHTLQTPSQKFGTLGAHQKATQNVPARSDHITNLTSTPWIPDITSET
jgi:hypothetical protein